MSRQLQRLTSYAREAFIELPPVKRQLLSALDDAFRKDPGEGFAHLRRMRAGTVGQLLLGIPPGYRHAAEALPVMPSDDVQESWTGNHGGGLLRQSVAFVDAVAGGYRRHGSVALADARVLDYGCGWGRLMRLMYAHVRPDNLYGCDPWDTSLKICREANVRGHLAQCDYIPERVPFDTSFQLSYAFSVFTHLSQRTADAVMAALRRCIARDGVLVVTVRPDDYWDHHPTDAATVRHMKTLHARHGFAFMPHEREAVDGEVTYGDTSMTLDYIAKRWGDWRIVESSINARDPLQRLVFMVPA